jgi:hypothetical protein
MPILFGGALALVASGAVLMFSTSGLLGISGGERSAVERAELLASGDCVVRNGQTLGRIEGILGPSRGNPHRRYHVALLNERKVIQVKVDEVEVVSCSTL